MIHYEDNAREYLLEYLNKSPKKFALPGGKGTVLSKFKKDKSGESIYIIDDDGDEIADEEILESIERDSSFSNINDVKLFKDKKANEKYLVIFNIDFPTWLISALNQIGKQPSEYGFQNQKGKFHKQIREKELKENFKKLLIDMNKENSQMLQVLKNIFIKINHKA